MDNSEVKNNKKKKVIIIACVVSLLLIVGAAFTIFFIKKNKDAYRIIKVYEVDGVAKVKREGKSDMDAYKNMVLDSGDTVVVADGTLTLKLDDDKYVYAEKNTEFEVIATGTKRNSKTKINLKSGAITNEINNKLNDSSSYEINTQNSNMSVRGTIYRVEIKIDEDGKYSTKVSVFDGIVATKKTNSDGSISEKEIDIEKNKEIIITDEDSFDDLENKVRDIVYEELPESVILYLINKAEFDGKVLQLDITQKELEDLLKEYQYTVTFEYNGTVFGTQKVYKNECATEPSLKPSEKGKWDYDFSKPIEEDTVIKWK